jgi:mono/diheme cytochrome c family protein
MNMSSRSLAPVILAICLAPGPAAAQQRSTPPLALASMAGRDLFQFYCAPCHGRDAKGDGPVATALKTPPADLTTIARRSGGQFPRAKVVTFVTDEQPPIASHGPREMPVWGPIFRGLDTSGTRATQRIENLVSYLESIQAK